MQTVPVNLGKRSYSIYIGQNLLCLNLPTNSELLSRYFHNKRVLVVTNDTIETLYLSSFLSKISKAAEIANIDSVVLPDGEQYKTLEYLDKIFNKLLLENYARDCLLVALGGGVIGDMTGFAAACYQRGVDFVQVPTTLLAQVDSSVGGKTAVNHPLGKNMIGAFHQPNSVLIDTQLLTTLPEREFNAGMAEVIKYGIMWDETFFNWLENNANQLKAQEASSLVYAISRCCEIKADVVSEDETERGCRALLNLGHTFGHAIETHMGYGNWLHGEAVATGMVLAAKTANELGWISQNCVKRVIQLLNRFDLPIAAPEAMNPADFIQHMQRDKKVLEGKIRLVLPTKIGAAVVTSDVDNKILIDVLS
ncbi:3-dehydroquinate synthase [Parashewanella spongiae]|uniref:3-dehydroquinate synthase n=1 Tax=Parashewanella spongiae TaxID=342950 RepID=A0A3A6TPQ0_9GAMM|nr:3-dehydroquinate synthase [Parashewanella spongiae]MCL1078593.1 3-dehydroquinate synthase [Parashewanella spongiae]RJY13107.1 3-dehydroquinate synthase [Parashewanella spongiae]